MSEMNEYTPDLFELVDDEGNKRNFELIDAAEIDGEEYFALVPSAEDENFLDEDNEIVFLKTIEEDGEEILASIDDDDEFERVSKFFLERIADMLADDDFDDDVEDWSLRFKKKSSFFIKKSWFFWKYML